MFTLKKYSLFYLGLPFIQCLAFRDDLNLLENTRRYCSSIGEKIIPVSPLIILQADLVLVSRSLDRDKVSIRAKWPIRPELMVSVSVERAKNPGNSVLVIFNGGDVVKFQNLSQREQDICLRLTPGRCFADFTQVIDSLLERSQTRPH